MNHVVARSPRLCTPSCPEQHNAHRVTYEYHRTTGIPEHVHKPSPQSTMNPNPFLSSLDSMGLCRLACWACSLVFVLMENGQVCFSPRCAGCDLFGCKVQIKVQVVRTFGMQLVLGSCCTHRHIKTIFRTWKHVTFTQQVSSQCPSRIHCGLPAYKTKELDFLSSLRMSHGSWLSGLVRATWSLTDGTICDLIKCWNLSLVLDVTNLF